MAAYHLDTQHPDNELVPDLFYTISNDHYSMKIIRIRHMIDNQEAAIDDYQWVIKVLRNLVTRKD